MKLLPTVALCLSLSLPMLPTLAAAQSTTIWRCGADGRSYSDTPCPSSGRAVEVEAARPAADVDAAHARAAHDRQMAEQSLRERQHLEAAARGNGLGSFSAPSRAVAVKPPVKGVQKQQSRKLRQPEDAGTWRAVAPGSRQRKG